jgi:hypothetical protein
LFWSEGASNLRTLDSYLPKPEVALRETAAYLTSGAYRNFVPHWEQAQRWYYTQFGHPMETGICLCIQREMGRSLNHLGNPLRSADKQKIKSRGSRQYSRRIRNGRKFNEALDWAKKSLALFKEQTSDEKDSNVALLTLYEQVITSRIQANNKLNMQFGKE